MQNFNESEFGCTVMFEEYSPCWHLWTPEDNPIIFHNRADFKDGMSIVGICAKLCPKVKILTFELMSNHVHFTLSGQEEEVNDFFRLLKFLLANWLKAKGISSDLSRWSTPPRRIMTLNDLRNVIAYNNRNGFLVHPEHTPFSYLWGANRYFFNPEAKLRYSESGDKNLMTCRNKRAIIRSHMADDVAGPVMLDGYACPLDFCDIEAAERMFRDATHYLNCITRNVESQKTIAAEIGERIFYNDDELYKVVCSMARAESGQPSPSLLPKDAKLSIARTLHFDYNASNKQIIRMLRLDTGVVNAMFP